MWARECVGEVRQRDDSIFKKAVLKNGKKEKREQKKYVDSMKKKHEETITVLKCTHNVVCTERNQSVTMCCTYSVTG